MLIIVLVITTGAWAVANYNYSGRKYGNTNDDDDDDDDDDDEEEEEEEEEEDRTTTSTTRIMTGKWCDRKMYNITPAVFISQVW